MSWLESSEPTISNAEHNAILKRRTKELVKFRLPGRLSDRLAAAPWLTDYLIWEKPAGGRQKYPAWTRAMKNRLDEFFQIFQDRAPLPLTCMARQPNLSLRFKPNPPGGGMSTFIPAATASDVFLAHAAHALYLEANQMVSWSLAEMDDAELLELLCSNRYHSRIVPSTIASLTPPFYPAHILPGRDFQLSFDSDGYFCDPRLGFNFLRGARSTSGKNMIAGSARKTMIGLTDWCASSVQHGDLTSVGVDFNAWFQFEDRLRGTAPAGGGPVVITRNGWGCHSTANVLHLLARSVNIPLVRIKTHDSPGQAPWHLGLVFFDGVSPSGQRQVRVVWHVDDIYAMGLAPNFPTGSGGNATSESSRKERFFDAVWSTRDMLTAFGFANPGHYNLHTINNPINDLPNLGVEGGEWIDENHRDSYLMEQRLRAGTWNNFLSLYCSGPAVLDYYVNLWHSAASTPPERYTATAQAAIAAYGCTSLNVAFNAWMTSRNTSVLT